MSIERVALDSAKVAELSKIKFSQAYFWFSDEENPHFVSQDCFSFDEDKLIIEGGALSEDGKTSYNFRSQNNKNYYFKVEGFDSYERIEHKAFLKKKPKEEGLVSCRKICYYELWSKEEVAEIWTAEAKGGAEEGSKIGAIKTKDKFEVLKPFAWCFAGFE